MLLIEYVTVQNTFLNLIPIHGTSLIPNPLCNLLHVMNTIRRELLCNGKGHNMINILLVEDDLEICEILQSVFAQVTDMLNKAFEKYENLEGLIFNSDQGWQYQMQQYHKMLEDKGDYSINV